MELDIHGDASRLKRSLEKKGEEYAQHLVRAGLQGGKVIQAEAKRRAPVDTGRLRSSIVVWAVRQGDEVVIQVGTNVHYAIHVEYGHRQKVGQFVPGLGKKLVRPYVAGRYFMRNSLLMKRQAAIGAIVRALQKE